MLAPNLHRRDRRPEWMDDPNIPPELHAAALAGLRTLNTISRSTVALWGPLRRLARRLDRPLRVLDVACGAGDALVGLAGAARREGVPLRGRGVDLSDFALGCARTYHAKREPGAGLEWERADALAGPLPAGFDAVVSTLFLHHLDEGDGRTLLARMGEAAGSLVLVNDLIRSRASYAAVWLASWATRSPVVRVDGPLSVRAAYTVPELRRLARSAGLSDARIAVSWPARMQLEWWK